MGVVAAMRQPDAEDRASAALGIREQDAALLPGTDFQAHTVLPKCAGLILARASDTTIGTVVHGVI